MFTEDGEYLIQCREYCGFSHYNMKAKLFVEPAVTPAAAESPPTTTPATTATVAPTQQQEQGQQQQPSTNATSATSGNATSAAAGGGAGGVTLTILEGSSIQGNPDFDPDELKVKKGDKITVNNADTMPHTVTNGKSGSDPTSGKLFDTSIINGGDSAEIDTATVDAGAHPFYCMVHPYMTGTLTVE
jgi:cytochrome c oxidase subunit II